MSLIDESSAANARRTLGGLTLTITNLVALRGLSGPDLMGLVQTQFGSTFQDGLGATYIWNSADSTPDNGSTVIAPYVGPAVGRWNALAVAAAPSSSTLSVATIAALKAIASPNASITYFVQGYYAAGDGGGGEFRWNAGDTTPDNWGTTLALTAGGIGRFNRIYTGEPLSAASFGTYNDGQSHPISSAQATSINSAYAIGAVAGDETNWVAIQVAIFTVGQISIAANSPNNAYRYGDVVNLPHGVLVFNKTIQMCFGVTLNGRGRTSFHIDISGSYPTGTILYYTGAAAAAAINITGFVASTGLPVAYNVVMHGSDIDAGTYTACESAQVKNLTVYTTVANVIYGINLNGADTSNLINVCSNGFQTGINVGASWGGVLQGIHVLATQIALNAGFDTNGMSFNDLYLTCSSSATVGAYCLQTNYIRACHFSRIVCEHAQDACSIQNMNGCVMNGVYFEDIGRYCVNAISCYGLTMDGVYFNCLDAAGFNMQNYSYIVATCGYVNNPSGTPQISAIVSAMAAGSSLTLINFTPTVAERTKDFGSASMLQYINSLNGSGSIVQYCMAEGRTINIDMPDSSSQYGTKYSVNGADQWSTLAGPDYFRFLDIINSRYAFQFNIAERTFEVGSTQVLTVRQTGYTNPWTGTLERASALNASTVTLQQLAQRVAALQTDLANLTGHGLIGP